MYATTLPDELVIRAPIVDDADAVSELYNTCALDEIGAAITTPAETLKMWRLPGFDLQRDAWIIETPEEQVVGYMDVWSPEPYAHLYCDGRVQPAYHGRGIGAALLRLAETRARELMARAPSDARVVLTARTESANTAARRLFERQGYVHVRSFWRMGITLDHEPAAPEIPAGITIRAMIPGREERAVFEADEEAFKDHYDHHPIPFETWLDWQTSDDPEQHDPALWFLALDGEQIAGIALCEPKTTEDPAEGWVSTLGVRRPWRKRGLGLALLRHAFRAFYRRGTYRIGLNVDASSPTGATRLYERAGMRVVRQHDSYAKELRPGRDLSGN